MKKKWTVLAAICFYHAFVVVFFGCQSDAQKKEAKVETSAPAYDLLAVQKEADEQAAFLSNPEDWIILIEECESKIRENETEIDALKRYAEITETTRENAYKAKIDSLQRRCTQLRVKIRRFEQRQAEWELLHIDVRTDKPVTDQRM